MKTLALALLLISLSATAAAPEARYSEAKCERLDQRLEKINSQLRTGARAKQGERLKDKRRALKLERSQHCNP